MSSLSWDQPWNNVVNYDFVKGRLPGSQAASSMSTTTVSTVTCRTRRPNRADLGGMIPPTKKHITYGELEGTGLWLANVLKARSVQKGDRVCIYGR